MPPLKPSTDPSVRNLAQGKIFGALLEVSPMPGLLGFALLAERAEDGL